MKPLGKMLGDSLFFLFYFSLGKFLNPHLVHLYSSDRCASFHVILTGPTWEWGHCLQKKEKEKKKVILNKRKKAYTT